MITSDELDWITDHQRDFTRTEEAIALAARSGVSLDDLNEILISANIYGTMFDMLDWGDELAVNLSSEQFLCDLQDLFINVIDPQLVASGLK